jgi:aspartate/methionine/tyrosine aminotransferase
MNKIQQQSVTCAATFVQKAGVEALKSPLSQKCIEEMVKEFKKRRDLMISKFSKVNSLSIKKPQGIFYMFPDISNTGMSSIEFTEYLLEKKGVAVTPGSAFGGYDTHIRISFANSVENLTEAVKRIKEALGSREHL